MLHSWPLLPQTCVQCLLLIPMSAMNLHHVENRERMATLHRERMATLHLLLVCAFLLPLVRADYNCSRPNVIETYSYDFLRTFGKAATEVKAQAPKTPERFMNFTLASRDTNRNVTLWSQCTANDTERFCTSCISVLFTNIYEMCCEQKSSWGTINLRTSCSVGYTAPDYVIPGWTDPGDLPKQIQKQPEPLNLNTAAHSLPPLYSISFPAVLFNTFLARY